MLPRERTESIAGDAVAAGVSGYVSPAEDAAPVVRRLAFCLDRDGSRHDADGHGRYRHLVETSPVPINLLDEDGTCSWGNDAVLDLLGLSSRAELVGRSIVEFVHPEDRSGGEGSRREPSDGEGSGEEERRSRCSCRSSVGSDHCRPVGRTPGRRSGCRHPTSGKSDVFSCCKFWQVLTPDRSEVTSEDAHMTSTNDERADGTDTADRTADAGTDDAGTDDDAKPFGTRLWQLVVSITVLTGVSVVVGYGGGLLLWISACLGGPDPRTEDGELLRDRLLAWPERNREFMRRNGHGELPTRP